MCSIRTTLNITTVSNFFLMDKRKYLSRVGVRRKSEDKITQMVIVSYEKPFFRHKLSCHEVFSPSSHTGRENEK